MSISSNGYAVTYVIVRGSSMASRVQAKTNINPTPIWVGGCMSITRYHDDFTRCTFGRERAILGGCSPGTHARFRGLGTRYWLLRSGRASSPRPGAVGALA